jgi:hypothetical protein
MSARIEYLAIATDQVISARKARKLGVFVWCPHTLRRVTCKKVVIVRTWSRDCDMCESTSLTAYPANRRTMRKIEENECEGAEGPFTLRVINPRDIEDERSECGTRDRALEAWENGRGANAFSV